MKNFILALVFFMGIVTHADEIKYAPRQKVLQGERSLICVGVTYEQGQSISGSKCSSMGRQVAQFYDRNSRGLLKIKPKGVGLKVPCNQNGACYKKAVDMARAKYGKPDILMVTGNPGVSHAGSKTAYLRGTLYRDAQHEVGHLLGLGHAGSYINGKLEAYKDGGSVMGRFPSSFLTAPQYYSRGWLFEKEAALLEPGKIYELKRISNLGDKESLALVIVKAPAGGRDAYVSFPSKCFKGDSCAALHLGIQNGTGTQKVATFGDEYYDTKFTQLHIKKVGASPGKIQVLIDYQAKPKK